MQTNRQHDADSTSTALQVNASDIPRGGRLRSDSLPAIWNIREGQNVDFVGRETELEHIHRDLSKQGIAILNEDSPPVGGVGKSHIAREYAYRHAADYQVVWWVQSQEIGVLQFGYAQLMTALNLFAGVPDSPCHSVRDVREYLSTHGGWLLILDGLEDLHELKQLLPAPGAGHVIVTTLLGSASLPHPTIPISPLKSEESHRLLEARIKDISPDEVEAIHDRHHHVGQDDVGWMLPDLLKGILSVLGGFEIEILDLLQKACDERQVHRRVVDDQDSCHRLPTCPASGCPAKLRGVGWIIPSP